MNVRQRILACRILNQMEEMNKHGNKKVVKDGNGYKYINEKGEVLITAEMKERSK